MGLLQLGTFIFDTDDLPDKLELGGQQIAAIYQYPGGVKDVQVFGALDDTISMTGTFNYTAESKVAQIDSMFRSGGQYLLKVGSFKSITVVITKFKPVYRSPYAIDYTIELEPLGNNISANGNSQGSGNSTVSSTPASNAPAPQRVYTVIRGDCLWNIAKRYYGNGALYTKIFDANRNIIKYPNLIYPGQVIVIP